MNEIMNEYWEEKSSPEASAASDTQLLFDWKALTNEWKTELFAG